MEEQEKRKRGRPRKPPMPQNNEYLKRMDEEIVERVNNGKLPQALLRNKHYSLDPEARKPNPMAPRDKKEKFEMKERLIDDIISDIVNGVAKNLIMYKLEHGLYDYKAMGTTDRCEVMRCALRRLRWNREAAYEEHRDILWTRYENLYNMALKEADIGEARKCLSDMSRIFGLDADRTMEMTKVNDGKVVIRFGFNQPEDNVQDVDAEEVADEPKQIEFNEIEAPF